LSKHAKKSDHLQLVDASNTMLVEIPLPLLGALGNIEHSFFELCIGAGQQVLASMMEQDREDLCGPRWKRDPDRKAGRAGTTQSEVTLGGRRIAMARPRVRSQAGHEMELPSFAFIASRDPLDRQALDAVACGVSTRKYARSLDRLPEEVDERSVSKSSVSRRYVAMTTKQMTVWLTKPIGD
jgi:putative transposase